MNLFEVVGKIMAEQENETLKMEKKVLFIEGETFTEMEAVAMEWLNNNTNYAENTVIEGIKRVKYSDISFNETLTVDPDLLFGLTEYTPEDEEGRFWELTVQFDEEQDNGKMKSTKEKFIMPANSGKGAMVRMEEKMEEVMMPWKIVNCKELPVYACLVMNDTYKLANPDHDLDVDTVTGEIKPDRDFE